MGQEYSLHGKVKLAIYTEEENVLYRTDSSTYSASHLSFCDCVSVVHLHTFHCGVYRSPLLTRNWYNSGPQKQQE